MKKIDVLDLGYVIRHDTFGDDLTVVNAARVSYDKKKESFDEKDKKLMGFLAREGHTSPFRHAFLQFEVYAPLMVARQWWKYVVGSDHRDPFTAWNESSRRYVTEDVQFYVVQPDEWRSAPENSKQGSGEPVNDKLGAYLSYQLLNQYKQGYKLYEEAMEKGVCAEQARLFLPAYGLYVRWYWSASLQGVIHFLAQRLEHDAQKEIQDYAKAVLELTKEKFPNAIEAFANAIEAFEK
jgi:thymidylate synthase (FAD)